MIGALWTGISGLASHQTALDNESNNIANVNTVGYKSGRVSFADQVYQNSIGKGSFVQDAEKLFEQGSMKITGASYDVMLQGDGFFTVVNKNTLGTAETFYTRAGNFRMGESGTLQTADGFEVQGWAMSSIDTKNDVKSTNHNVNRFTDDYVKSMGSRIIRHGDYIETIAAKATNYSETAQSDNLSVFNGAGYKTKASKLKDIELAQKNYESMLQKYKDDPNQPSQGSMSQVSQIDFGTGVYPDSLLGAEGSSITVKINGNTYNQPYIVTKSTPDFRAQLWNSLSPAEQTLYSLTLPATIEAMPTTTEAERAAKDAEVAKYDQLAGKIETYKAMADKISNSGSGGLVAYMAKDRLAPTPPLTDGLNPNGMYEESTNLADILKGTIQIKSLIPGQDFKITEVSELAGETNETTKKGYFQTTASALQGSGKAAIDSARDALSRLVSGNQQSVYTTQDLYGNATAATSTRTYSFSIDIFDKDLGYTVPVPNDGAVPPQAVPIQFGPGATPATGSTIDDIVDAINNLRTPSGPQLGDYLVAKNVNGNLVIETNSSNYDVEFDAKLRYDDPTPDHSDPLNPVGPAVSDIFIEVNPDYSGRKGAGAEFMEIVTRVDQSANQSSLQLRLDALGISDNKFGKFSVDSTGLITIKEGGVEYAVGQLSIARFTNNRGLEAVGGNNFQKTQESGNAIYSINNNNTDGVRGQALELSKADLSESLVNLMVFQRAFEANAKSITTSDELLSTLINLKR
ncbi:flagellar hook-basal body complex protein [Aliarcobacter lanthieri]|uniref:flagellar hook-basal body complex protein n=1 Tax=Aliarcobacter lanthieri TaxID=1355374 RepID=UPI003AAF9F51